MRYETRWSNGFWKTFDTRYYCGVEMHATRADAAKATAEWNANGG